MKAVDGGFNTALQSGVTQLCQLLEITRRDGVIYRRSTATRAKTFEDEVFEGGGFDPTDISSTSSAGVSDVEVVAYFNDELTLEDVSKGKLDDASCRVLWAFWPSPELGTMTMFSGVVSNTEITDDRTAVRFSMSGQISTLLGSIGEVRSATCRAVFGDDRCKVDIDALKVSAEVVSLIGKTLVVDIGAAEPLINTDAHEYWRIRTARATGRDISYSSIVEVEFRELVAGSNEAVGGTPIAGMNSATAGNAFDASDSTEWRFTSQQSWIGYQFATPINIREIAVKGPAVTLAAPSALTVEWSNDADEWTAVVGLNFTNLSFASSETKVLNASDGSNPVTPSGAFSFGSVYFIDGAESFDIVSAAIAGSDVTLKLASTPLFTVEAGDLVDLYPGCDKTLARCKFYSNVVNFRGEPYTPTSNYQGQNSIL